MPFAFRVTFTPAWGVCYKPSIEFTPHTAANIDRKASRPEGFAGTLPSAALTVAYQDQDRQFQLAFSVLQQAIDEHAFPGACAGVVSHGRLTALKACGNFTYDAASPAVTTGSIFDLASVSKVVATATMAMVLYERGILDVEMPLAAIVPEFSSALKSDPRRKTVTLHMLLAHSSGLAAYEKLFLRTKTREELLALCFQSPLVADPGSKAEYSDLGFILLGLALERLADEPLDGFCQREIFGPLGMANTMFTPPASLRSQIVPTADDRAFRHRVIQGEVQDENASILGGVAGHAGVFSAVHDLAIFSNVMLHGGAPLVRPETLRLFTRREPSPAGTSRTLGWDTPSAPSQSGQYFSSSSFGHLGYTGTSLWLDPERQLSIILLTNRTWPDCSNQAIKQVRPKFHDAVIEALES